MKDKTYYKRYREKLPDSYIKDTLKKSGLIGITEEMIEEKRFSLKSKREKYKHDRLLSAHHTVKPRRTTLLTEVTKILNPAF